MNKNYNFTKSVGYLKQLSRNIKSPFILKCRLKALTQQHVTVNANGHYSSTQ